MAIYHLTVKNGSRAADNSALAKHDYIARVGRYDDRVDLAHTESGNLPTWAQDAATFWAGADEYSRANGRLYTEVEMALPLELSKAELIELVRGFVAQIAAGKGGLVPYTWGMHLKDGNPHLHVALSSRIEDGVARADAQGWFKRANSKEPAKGGARSWAENTDKDWLENVRATWAKATNEALARAKSNERVDHRSHARRGLGIAPTKHVGWAPRQRERVLAHNESVRAANAEATEALEQLRSLRKKRRQEQAAEQQVRESLAAVRLTAQRQVRLDREAEEIARVAAAGLRREPGAQTIQGATAPGLLPEFLARKGHHGTLYIRMPADALAMVDTGGRIILKEDESASRQAALKLAASRWSRIRITCNEDARDEWLEEAKRLGLADRISFRDDSGGTPQDALGRRLPRHRP